MNRRQGFGLAAGLAGVLGAGIALAQQSNVPIFADQGGTSLVIGSGGKLTVRSGGTLTLDAGATVTGLPSADVANTKTLTVASGGTLAVASGGTLNLAAGATLTADTCTTPVPFSINSATTDYAPIFVAPRAWKVEAVRSVVATAAGASLTATVLKVPAGTASSAGTALTTGAINLDTVSTTPVSGTLVGTAGVTSLAATDRLVLHLSDVVAAAIGNVTVCLGPQ